MTRRVLLVLALVAVIVSTGCLGGATTVGDGSGPTATVSPTETPGETGTVEVHFINVGQSVSTLIVGPTNETMLVDTGNFYDDGEHVLTYLRKHDIDRIDHLVVSHVDADHIGGNAEIIEYFETEADGIGTIYDPGIVSSTQTYSDYLDAVEEHNVTLYETREGDTIPFAGVNVSVLGPPEPYLEDGARNENSIVLRLSYGQTSFLLTGDAEDDQEAYLVEHYGSSLQSTIFKAGHHGSKSSSSGALLDAVSPRAVVVSSAYDSQYGHPHNETLQRFANRSLATYWTATHGDIVLVSDGQDVRIKTQQDAPTDALSLRQGDPVQPGANESVTTRAVITNGTVVTPVQTDGGTATATPTEPGTSGSLAVAEIHADAAGDDRENLTDEFVVFRNTGTTQLTLTNWTVSDEAGHTYAFPDGFTLGANETVTLYTGSGTDTQTELYWNAGSPIWNNGGDTVIVTNSAGEKVLSESYE